MSIYRPDDRSRHAKNAPAPHIPDPANPNGTFPKPPLKPEMYPRQFNPIGGRPGMAQYHDGNAQPDNHEPARDQGLPGGTLQMILQHLMGRQ